MSTIAEIFGLKEPARYKSKVSEKVINPDLLVGVEIEIEQVGRSEDTAKAAGNFWGVVEDGSLRPRHVSWELVSRPAAMTNALAEIRALFQKLRLADNVHFGDRTSIHVHTNILNFTQDQLANVALIYPVFEDVLFQFVNQYKKREEQGYCRDTNLYCIPWNSCRLNKQMVEKVMNNINLFSNARRFGGGGSGWQKYTALNFVPVGEKGTIEWRHMHGTSDMDKLTIWFNIIGAIMEYCQKHAFIDIKQTILSMNDVSAYHRFFTDVLQNALPYSEEYRKPMAEGVINAKYSLMDFSGKKEVPPKKEETWAALYGGGVVPAPWGAAQEEAAVNQDALDRRLQEINARHAEALARAAGAIAPDPQPRAVVNRGPIFRNARVR